MYHFGSRFCMTNLADFSPPWNPPLWEKSRKEFGLCNTSRKLAIYKYASPYFKIVKGRKPQNRWFCDKRIFLGIKEALIRYESIISRLPSACWGEKAWRLMMAPLMKSKRGYINDEATVFNNLGILKQTSPGGLTADPNSLGSCKRKAVVLCI